MDVVTLEVFAMVLMGSSFGIAFGGDKASALENLPKSKSLPRWVNQVSFAALVVLALALLVANGFDGFTVRLVGLMTLGFLIGFSISAALGFLITRHLAKKRSSA
jgi:hypothetical protein